MTKFILHGGGTRRKTSDNLKFYKEIVKGVKGQAKILLVFFAGDKPRWQRKFIDLQRRFRLANPRKKFKFKMANERTINSQLKWADVLYFNGGSEIKLKRRLKKVKNIEEAIKNKIVVGISAGVNIWSKYYFTNDRVRLESGYGILPIKTICHYKKSRKSRLGKLVKHAERLKTYSIPEEKIIIIRK